MSTAVIALAAAAAALVVVGGLAVAGGRARRASERRITRALGEVGARMDALSHELSDAIARAQDESRRIRAIGQIGGVVDLDEVLAQIVDAVASLPGVAASLVRIVDPDGEPVVASLGLPTDAAERQLVSGPPDGQDARATVLGYIVDGPPGDGIQSGVAVPIAGEDGRLGFLAAYVRHADWAPDDELLADLEAIAERAGPAVEHALRYRLARQQVDVDGLTGLANRSTCFESLNREVARGHRYSRRLALIVLDVDGFRALNDRIGYLAGDHLVAELSERLREVVRTADIPCRVGIDDFAVILPESGVADAEGLYARIRASLERRPPARVERIGLSAGITELRGDDDAVALYERAEQALRRAKEQGGGTAAVG